MVRPFRQHKRLSTLIGLTIVAITSTVLLLPPNTAPNASAQSAYIVQAASAAAAADAVSDAGGAVTRQLAIINGVGATLDRAALGRLRLDPQVMVHADSIVRAAGDVPPAVSDSTLGQAPSASNQLLYPSAATGAHQLHSQQISGPELRCQNQQVTTGAQVQRKLQGWGVTVAVIDSGFMRMSDPASWNFRDPQTGTLYAENVEGRCIVYHDFLPRNEANENTGADALNSTDQNGHGTHVISTIADNRMAPLAPGQQPAPVGVAPKVNLMIARVLDKHGVGTYGGVISAIEWVVNNRHTYKVRVLNLSIYTPVTGPYWADPLDQAVMRAWQAGIVVVTAAGNAGPDAGTITVPGNTPYVISVGAIKSGRYTRSGGDELAFYSSRGPTESAFVKPDVLVPASRTIAPIPDGSTLARQLPEARVHEKANVDYGIGAPSRQHTYYQLSGTSMAAAEVSGVVALMLQSRPTLSNNQVKYRLLITARLAFDAATGKPAYSVWEQGAGLIDTKQAVVTTTVGLANPSMDITQDLSSATHYWGNTEWNAATGEFQLIDPATGQTLMIWSGTSRVWSGTSRVWSGTSRVWSGTSRVWSGTSRVWSGGTATWASSDSLWAGTSRVWSGSIPATSPNTAAQAEILVNDESALEQPCGATTGLYCVTLPLVRR